MTAPEITNAIQTAFIQTSFAEWIIFISALIYILLIAVENTWGWMFGIIASLVSVYLCFTGNLFLESGLNIFYVIIGFYGWYQWLYGSKEKKEIQISKNSKLKNSYLILLGCLIWIPFALIANKYSTQAMPYLDAFITAFSLIATWMTTKKMIENWLYWIIVDALGILLFANREFYLLALLNIIYTSMALAGYFSWRKKMTSSELL
jgi:nicotinamide mononucleotide transporter